MTTRKIGHMVVNWEHASGGTLILKAEISSGAIAEIHELDGVFEARVIIPFLQKKWTSTVGDLKGQPQAQAEAESLLLTYYSFLQNIVGD